jgi:hypothetical protein
MTWLHKIWQWLSKSRGATPVSTVPVTPTGITVFWINQSQDTAGNLTVQDSDLDKIVEALNFQAYHHLADHWGNIRIAHEVLASGAQAPSGAQGVVKAYLLANSDVADALGYHDVDPQGDPYIRVFTEPILTNGGTVLSGSLSVSACASHEACEEAVDPQCQEVVMAPNGDVWCVEVGDPVQDNSYDVTLKDGSMVAVSDFVTPQFFEAASPGARYDYLQVLSEPFTIASGGYAIIGGQPVYGEHYEDKGQDKTFPASRTYRRTHASTR